jgi:hypothetical protein
MNEQIKLADAEIVEIRKLQEDYKTKMFQIGQLHVNRLMMEDSLKELIHNEDHLKSEWKAIQKAENDLIDKLLKKYGEGALDINSGIFVPETKK